MAPSSMGEDLSLSSLGAEFESLWGHVEYQIVSEEEFPWGVQCPECHRILQVGQPYVTKLEDMASDEPIEMVYCVYC